MPRPINGAASSSRYAVHSGPNCSVRVSARPAAAAPHSAAESRSAASSCSREIAIDAARKRATLGEISSALEKVWGRYRATTHTIAGVYSAESGKAEEFKKAERMAAEFEQEEGRRPRILVAKMGQDGHDRGAKVIATAGVKAEQ